MTVRCMPLALSVDAPISYDSKIYAYHALSCLSCLAHMELKLWLLLIWVMCATHIGHWQKAATKNQRMSEQHGAIFTSRMYVNESCFEWNLLSHDKMSRYVFHSLSMFSNTCISSIWLWWRQTAIVIDRWYTSLLIQRSNCLLGYWSDVILIEVLRRQWRIHFVLRRRRNGLRTSRCQKMVSQVPNAYMLQKKTSRAPHMWIHYYFCVETWDYGCRNSAS